MNSLEEFEDAKWELNLSVAATLPAAEQTVHLAQTRKLMDLDERGSRETGNSSVAGFPNTHSLS